MTNLRDRWHNKRKIATAAILTALTVALLPAYVSAQTYNYSLISTPTSLSFKSTTDSTPPPAQTLTVWDTSPCPPSAAVPTCHWPTTFTTDQFWLSVSSPAGTTGLTTNVSVNPTGLAAGVYTGNVIATATQLTGSPIRIPVTLSIISAVATSTLTANPASLSFGAITLGNAGTLATILTNIGNSSIAISNVGLSGPGLTASGISSGETLAPNQIATLTVIFAPTAPGGAAGSLTITSNASNSPTTIATSGTGVAVGSHLVSLSWTSSASMVVGYNVYRGTVSGGPYMRLTTNLNELTTYIDNTVSSGTMYYYVVTAVDAAGNESVYSVEASAAVPYLVALSWTSSDSAVVGYNVYRGTVSGGPYMRLTTNLNELTSYIDSNVTSGTTYYYVATAVDATGDESVYSVEAPAAVP